MAPTTSGTAFCREDARPGKPRYLVMGSDQVAVRIQAEKGEIAER
jgi:hypothetical protein